MDLKTYKQLFLGFFRAGMLGYGGGPSSIPLVYKEVVETYHWMNDEEFSDVLALGNILPGPIATKMAGYIGYRVAGKVGLLTAIIATVLPTVLLMIALIGFLTSFRDSTIVQGMTQAVAPVVGVMLIKLAYCFLSQSKIGLGLPATILLAVISGVAYIWFSIHPAIIIGILLLYALLARDKQTEADYKKVSSE